MLEIAIKGSKNYWLWIVFLLAVIGAGAVVYIDQFMNGLMITNMSR
ncbi:MAG: menaquinol oxidoreductase, partial [Desulfobacula sp.]|nr:menaquinol oxidoreductase [Desulfobacula sp.]